MVHIAHHPSHTHTYPIHTPLSHPAFERIKDYATLDITITANREPTNTENLKTITLIVLEKSFIAWGRLDDED